MPFFDLKFLAPDGEVHTLSGIEARDTEEAAYIADSRWDGSISILDSEEVEDPEAAIGRAEAAAEAEAQERLERHWDRRGYF